MVDRLCTPQPIGTLIEKISLCSDHERIRGRTRIRAKNWPIRPWIMAGARALPGWQVHEIEAGHDLMIDAPGPLADLVCRLDRRRLSGREESRTQPNARGPCLLTIMLCISGMTIEVAVMGNVTLAQATAIISAALGKGEALGLKPLTVAVLDAGGHLTALHRQDGSATLRPQIAIAKAAGALGLGLSSRKIGEMAAERPGFVNSLSSLAPNGMVPAAGGVIVVDEAGAAIGAVGITGDTSDNDEACALAGVSAAGLTARA